MKNHWRCALGGAWLLCAAGAVWAQASLPGSGAQTVLVVANKKSEVSGRIARYYALKRGLAPDRLCWVDAPEQETIERGVYESSIEKPVRQCLVSRGLVEKVLYIALTKGVPLLVKGPGGEFQAQTASTDSELTLLYSRIHGKPVPPPAGFVPNPFYRQTQTPFTHPQFPMYLVTRLDAYDFPAVKGMIDRALEAERAPNQNGRIYLDMRDGSDEAGEAWLRDAVILLPAGRGVLEQTQAVVYGKQDALGYASWGSNDKKHAERRLNFRWLPGALATEYVSSDGRTMKRPPANWRIGTWANPNDWYANSPQSMTADFIEDGATGASGHVYEPYLHMTPHPDLLFPAYLSGRNLAESFYLSIQGLSWMNVFLGDPLCRLRQ
jgi:uncharacterized protein (TIGR03790 family)